MKIIYGHNSPYTAHLLFSNGSVHVKLKHQEIALAYFHEALDIYESLYGRDTPDHPDILKVKEEIKSIK